MIYTNLPAWYCAVLYVCIYVGVKIYLDISCNCCSKIYNEHLHTVISNCLILSSIIFIKK